MTDANSRRAVTTDTGPFAIVPLWMIERLNDTGHTASALSVFIALHRWTNEDRSAWPSHASIAEVAHLSVASVKRGLKALEDIGAVVIVPRWIDANGDSTTIKPTDVKKPERTSNGYHLRYSAQHSEPGWVQNRPDPSGQNRPDPSGQNRPDPSGQNRPSNQTHCEPDPSEPSLLSSEIVATREPDNDAESGFDRFWAQYPRKVQKRTAALRWKNMTKRDRLAALEGIEQHVERWRSKGTEERFIPHPATWLHGRRWEDQLESDWTPDPQPNLSKAAQTITEMIRHAADRGTTDRGLPRGPITGLDG